MPTVADSMADNLDDGGAGRPFDFATTSNGEHVNTRNGSHTPPGSPGRSIIDFDANVGARNVQDNVGQRDAARGPQFQNFDVNGSSLTELQEQVKILTSIALENKSTGVSLAKRFKAEREFGSTGNSAQYSVIMNVISACDEADYALSVNNFAGVSNCISQIRKFNEERKKFVIMADTSEFGWATVKAFQKESNDLNDSDDKRLKRVEAALRTQKKEKQDSAAKAQSKGKGPVRGRGGRGAANNVQQNQSQMFPVFPQYNPCGFSSPSEMYYNQSQQPFPAYAGHFPGYAFNQQAPRDKSNIKCHGCFQYGHYKNACPNAQTGFTNVNGNVPK